MPSPFFSGRIPEDLNERIQQHCAETGESKTQVLLNALSKYLDFPIKPPATTGISTERFSQLERRVTELEKKLEITNVSSADNSMAEVDRVSDNNNNLVEQPDNNLIKENETSGNNADAVKEPDNSDNADNQIVRSINGDRTQLSISGIEQQPVEVNQSDRKPWIVKTNDAPNLPGLEKMDKNKVSQKLRNTKAAEKTEVRIGQYLLRYCGKEEGIKVRGSLLWEVIPDDNT
ncbi:hypothetical protein Cri9333_5001 (plasmid) [Crinalium epipsammum PCC 9333]|uniref:Uncharacterized protein n=1 Tax=Crinalium epipsammum PCC 9333 TaxID=1173022 RepID=K9W6F4_9CYAN|nr:hypothetical protein [Crinalium epipsammum]AFZ15756.1 hypothetical protein Cri9333_5001 [Crinalium epipsammum PCC 9333]